MNYLRIVFPMLILLAAAVLLSACSFSMAEDITPPPGAQVQTAVTVQPASPQSAGPLFPLVAPDPANGKAIFEQKCAPCHGPQGLGDGPQAAQLPNPPAPLGQPDFARQATPAEWYAVVTNGNIDKFMPPFVSLSDGERWDVVAYALTLSTPAETLARGESLFAENCARCHGVGGNGDGPDAAQAGNVPAFTDQAFMAQFPAEDMAVTITNGQGNMPAFGDQLSADDIWALTGYLRSLSFAGGSVVAAQSQATPAVTVSGTLTSTTASPTPSVPLGVVLGTVTNGSASADSSLTGLPVTLYVIENMTPVFTETATLDESGAFTFEDVEIIPERMFVVTVDYADATYGSDIGIFQEGSDTVELPVTVFEPTHDPTVLSVDRLHVFFDFSQPDVLQVVELYVISNNTDKAVVPTEPGGGVVPFTLPEGAGEPQFQDGTLGGRYLPTADGFMDTLTVRPSQGQYQVLYATTLPFNKKLTFRQSLPLNVEAVLFMVPDGIKVKSDVLEDSGTRDVQGVTYRTYTGDALSAGSTLEAIVSGKSGSSVSLPANTSGNSLAIGLGAFGAALIGAGLWFYRRNWQEEIADTESEEALEDAGNLDDPQLVMDAIIALDDLYKAGELPEAAYRARRSALKARLKDLLDEGEA
ncbi:MAG: hypothetical protein Fur0018_14740 [Anaerolineales bacterium]